MLQNLRPFASPAVPGGMLVGTVAEVVVLRAGVHGRVERAVGAAEAQEGRLGPTSTRQDFRQGVARECSLGGFCEIG